jgi:localization factor PodJL
MTAGIPWSVNAVEPETWAAAREAARRSGLSVGEWLEETIRDLAEGERRPQRGRREAPSDDGTLRQRLDDIAEQLDHLLKRSMHRPQGAAPGGRPDPALAGAVGALNDRVEALMQDLDAADRHVPAQVAAALKALDARLDVLSAQSRTGVSPELEHRLGQLIQAVDRINQRLDGDLTPRGGGPASIADLDAAIAQITTRQSVLDGGPRAAAAAAASARHDPHMMEAFAALARRIDQLGERIDAANTTSSSPALTELAGRLDDLRRSAARQPDFSGIERQLQALAQHMQRPPAPALAPDLSGLEHQLKVMADEMQQIRRAGGHSQAIEELRREISDLAHILAELAPRSSIDALNRTVEALAQRVDHAARAAPRQDYVEVASALAEIRAALSEVRPAESFRAVENDLHQLSRKLDSLTAKGMDAGAISRIQAEIGEIRAMLASALPTDVLKALVDQIEVLVQKFESTPAASTADAQVMNAFAAVERRIDSLGEQIETVSRAANGPAITDIARRLDELQRALAGMSQAAPAGLESVVRELAAKLDAAETRLANLGAIERGLNDLFAQFEETRASAIEIAERAARSAIREAAATLLPRTPQPMPAVEPIRHSPIETTTRPVEPVAPPVMRDRTPDFAAARPAPVTHDEAGAAYEPAGTSPVATAVEPRPAPLAGDLPPDYPLEPGSGAPRNRATASAAERIAQSQAALGEWVPPPRPAETTPRAADFIAAARRAAQQAAAEKAAEKSHNRAVDAVKELGATLGRSKRALLVGLLVLLLVVFGTIRYGESLLPGFFSSGETPAPAVAPAPAAAPPQEPETPSKPESEPTPGRSAIPQPTDPTLASAPPAGVLGPASTPALLAPQPDPRDTTGSTPAPKPAAMAFPPKDLPASIGTPALRAAALAGDPSAAYEIATRYFDGRSVEANATESLRWFELARAAGSIPAAFRLGGMHEKGQGLPRNMAEARRYYLLAAEGGHVKAMHNLAVLHAEGLDGKPDFRSAAHWFRQAADRGLRDSQYNLGVLYARGLGLEQNLAESYRWFALAAIQGDPDAIKKRDDVAARLDPQTMIVAKLAVQTWKPVPVDPAANTVTLRAGWDKTEPAPARKRSARN